MSQTWVTSFHRAGATGILPSGFAAAPTFSPGAGSYIGTQHVTIASTTPIATIYYTTDGTTPTLASLLYTGPVSVSVNETLSAIAVVAGFLTSPVSSAIYVLLSFAGETLPGFTPGVAYSQNVSGQVTGGVLPLTFSLISETGTNLYGVSSAGTITSNPTGGTGDTLVLQVQDALGSIAQATFLIPPANRATTPAFSPVGGTYPSAQTVTITSNPGATIYYTTDGSTPTILSTVYTGPILVSGNLTLNAIAVLSGFMQSALGSATYVFTFLASTWPDPLPSGTVGVFYAFTLTATGGVPPYSFFIVSGTLPAGLTLNSITGGIAGTPTTPINLDAIVFGVSDSAALGFQLDNLGDFIVTEDGYFQVL